MNNRSFGILLNCIDGRTQMPAIQFITKNYGVAYVDLITEPGMDKLLCEGNEDKINYIKEQVYVSLNNHNSNIIVIAGHYDCAGNPVEKNCHVNHLREAKKIVTNWNTGLEIKLLWINENFQVEEI